MRFIGGRVSGGIPSVEFEQFSLPIAALQDDKIVRVGVTAP